MRKYKIYTGPCITYETAAKLRSIGIVYLIGTEHIYLATNKTFRDILAKLPTWKLQDIQSVQS